MPLQTMVWLPLPPNFLRLCFRLSPLFATFTCDWPCAMADLTETRQTMKIGFDAKRAAQNRTGLGNYSRFVARVMAEQMPGNEYRLYVPDKRRTPFLGEIPAVAALPVAAPHGLWRHFKAGWRSWGIAKDLRRDGIELYHGLSNELPLDIKSAGCRSVVTIHDLIFLRHPEYYQPIDRWIYDRKFRRACLDADRIVAVSEFTKRDIIHYYNIDEAKIDVVCQGCDRAFAEPIGRDRLEGVRRKYGLPETFVLYVGSIEERKNVGLLIDALRGEAERGLPFHIVMVGRSTPYCERQKEAVERSGLGDWCHFFHGVPFADLPSFYRMAAVFVYPSRIEGFGIPLLEAITSGVPAIGCTGSCLEEAGGEDSIYVAPDDAQGLGESIVRLLSDGSMRSSMVERGRAYAQNFTDSKLSRRLMDVYDRVMEQ